MKSIEQMPNTIAKPDPVYNPFSGNIFIDGKYLNVQLTLLVKSEGFEFTGDYMMLQNEGGFKTLVFMYFNKKHPNVYDDGYSNNVPMNINFTIENKFNGEDQETIRLMCLNDNNQDVLYGLEDYFLQRLTRFEILLKPGLDYKLFNDSWNDVHKYNTVNTSDFLPRKTKDDGILTLFKNTTGIATLSK